MIINLISNINNSEYQARYALKAIRNKEVVSLDFKISNDDYHVIQPANSQVAI